MERTLFGVSHVEWEGADDTLFSPVADTVETGRNVVCARPPDNPKSVRDRARWGKGISKGGSPPNMLMAEGKKVEGGSKVGCVTPPGSVPQAAEGKLGKRRRWANIGRALGPGGSPNTWGCIMGAPLGCHTDTLT
jgi:hypothetical protein